jgi:hypothetical protein
MQFELLTYAGCRGAVSQLTINGTAHPVVYAMDTDPATGQM